MAEPQISQRLAELLAEPQETLEVEVKGWIDIVNDGDHKAVLAKAVIALANHGGGIVIVGFEKSANGLDVARGRPADLSGYTSDAVNAVVTRYAEPPFHCDVHNVARPGTTDTYPMFVVPGGHKVPIRSKRSGPNGQTIQANTYYIRRPGPKSEAPQSAREWEELIRRCLSNARDELLNQFRTIMEGGAASRQAKTDVDLATDWVERSKARWADLSGQLPPQHFARLPLGGYSVGYRIVGDFEQPTLGVLLEELRSGPTRHSGWPPFWVPNSREIEPYPQDGSIECWLGPMTKFQDPAHSDFWRASPSGAFFLLRGYEEDGAAGKGRPPGQIFDITLPTYRLGEILLHAATMAHRLGASQASVVFVAEWTGLAGRELAHWAGTRLISPGYVSRQSSYRTSFTVDADKISDQLPEIVHTTLSPLYELFGFFKLPKALVVEESARMRASRF